MEGRCHLSRASPTEHTTPTVRKFCWSHGPRPLGECWLNNKVSLTTLRLFGADSYHTGLSDGEGEQDQEDGQKRSELDGEAAWLALKADGGEGTGGT